MNSIDRPTGGDGDPDRFSGREDRPFPGAPPDREPVSAPGPSPSMDQMREAFARSSNSDELQAAARADEAAAGEAPAGKGTAAAKPGSDAAAARDATVPRDPAAGENGEQRGEEADSEAAKETVPEQPVAQHEMPAAEAPEGEPAPLDDGRPGASLGNQPDARHEEAVVLDQGEDAEAEPRLEGIEPTKDAGVATRSDATAPTADDKPVVAGVIEPDRPEVGLSPDERETGETNASRSEVRLDSQSDDQRPVTRAEIMAIVSELEARHRAEIDAVKAEQRVEHEAEIGSLKADYDAKFDELKAKVEGGQQDGDAPTGRKADSHEGPDVSDAEQRGDRLPRGLKAPDQVLDDPRSQRQDAMLDGREGTRQTNDDQQSDVKRAPRWRRAITAENVGAAGTLVGAVNTVAQFSVHATPEGMASLGIMVLGLASLGIGKIEKRRKEKNDHH